MLLKTALARSGATIEEAELLQGLKDKANGAEFRVSLTKAVEELVPGVTKHHTRAIIDALKADKFVTNQNGQGSNPKWELNLAKFSQLKPEPVAVPEVSLSEQLEANGSVLRSQLEEAAARVRAHEDAAKIAAGLNNDPDRIARAVAVLQQSLSR